MSQMFVAVYTYRREASRCFGIFPSLKLAREELRKFFINDLKEFYADRDEINSVITNEVYDFDDNFDRNVNFYITEEGDSYTVCEIEKFE
jgi:hypothetical protein